MKKVTRKQFNQELKKKGTSLVDISTETKFTPPKLKPKPVVVKEKPQPLDVKLSTPLEQFLKLVAIDTNKAMKLIELMLEQRMGEHPLKKGVHISVERDAQGYIADLYVKESD